MQSQIASHTAAGALLFNQLLSIGCPCEVQPDTMVESAVSVLTDLTQIQVKCPFNFGILDGLLMLLNQMLNQVKFGIRQNISSFLNPTQLNSFYTKKYNKEKNSLKRHL